MNRIFQLLLFCILFNQLIFAGDSKLTNGDGDNYGNDSPCFSPDGKKIAFSSSINETYHIWVMNSDGTQKKELTTLSWDMSPAWSPDGDVISFNSYGLSRKNGRFAIWMVDLNTGKTWEFIKPHKSGDQYSCWSPDGKEIVWTHGKQLWISDSKDSGKARPLTANPAEVFEFCGDWSPDGKWIAYIAADTYNHAKGNPYKMWRINRDGTEQSLIFNGISANKLKFSSDGKYIIYSTDKDLMKLNINTGEKTRIIEWNNSNNRFDLSDNDRFMVYGDCGAGWSGNIFIKEIELLLRSHPAKREEFRIQEKKQ